MQAEDVPLPAKVQEEGAKVPGPLLLNDTVPVGVVMAPDVVSHTVALQAEEDPTCREEGEHAMLVEVLLIIVWPPSQSCVPCGSEDAPPPMTIESTAS